MPDYLARVERTVGDNLNGNAIVIGLLEWEVTEREGFWERIYYVAWKKEARQHQPSEDGFTYGTHRVSITSKDQAALFHGHYDMKTARVAIADMIERVYGSEAA